MNKPKNIHDALHQISRKLSLVYGGIGLYLDNPGEYEPEFLQDKKTCAMDAQMLLTWVRDQLGESK